MPATITSALETCPDDSLLLAYAQAALPSVERDAVDLHLGACPACCELVAETAKLIDAESLHTEGPTSAAPTSEPPMGTHIGRYERICVIGRGGAGVVYAANDPELHRRVAIKVLRADVLEREQDDSRARLLREARAMARVSHPNVVAIYDVGVWSDQVFVAMELVKGRTLRSLIRDETVGMRARIDYLVQAGRGLCAAHAVGIVHRDFKPENVLVGDDGRVRVTDFGLAKPSRGDADGARPRSKSLVDLLTTVTMTGRMTGTPAYMAPEQFLDTVHDARVDQFAFSVVLFETLYGIRPFAGAKASEIASSVLEGRVSDVVAPPPDVPTAFHAVILRGLSRDPDARYPSLADLIDALTPAAPTITRRRSWVVVIAAAALLLLFAVPLAILRARTSPASPPTTSAQEPSPSQAPAPAASESAAAASPAPAGAPTSDDRGRTAKHGPRPNLSKGRAAPVKGSARAPQSPPELGDRVQDPF